MACILKAPRDASKGILIFTTVDWKKGVSLESRLYQKIAALKDRWVIGLHHNSAHADHEFEPDPLFDFHIAGAGDLVSSKSKSFRWIQMDCSNFCADFFELPENKSDAFWDLLLVARYAPFKSLSDMIHIVRKIFDLKRIRVMAIVSHQAHQLEKSTVIAEYLKSFSAEERKFFTLLTPTVDYPFSFDLETLAHFYQNSKAFLHVAHQERHPRVVAYAWAAGLPVIAPKQVASLLPAELQAPPGFYAYRDLDDAAQQVFAALDADYPKTAARPYVEFHLGKTQLSKFKNELKTIFTQMNLSWSEGDWFLSTLDLRLARNHVSENSPSSFDMSLEEFINVVAHKELPLACDPVKDVEQILDQNYVRATSASSNAKPYSVRKVFLHAALLILGVIAIDQMLLRVGNAFVASGYYEDQLFSQMIKQQDVDVVIIGGCRAALSLDPKILSSVAGETFFNAGRSIDGLGNMEFTIEALLSHNHPKNVVLVIDDGNWEETMQTSRPEVERRLMWLPLLSQERAQRLAKKYSFSAASLHSGLYLYKGLGEPLLRAALRLARHQQQPPKDGYVPRSPRQNISKALSSDQSRVLSKQLQTFSPSPYAEVTVRGFIRDLKSAGITPILMAAPMNRFRAVDSVNDQQIVLIKKIAQEESISYLSYLGNSAELANQDSLWSDSGHLNQLGAENFSQQFAADFKAIKK